MPLRLLCNTTGCEFRFEGESPEELDRALVVHSQRTGHHRATRSVVEVDWKTRAQTAEAAVRGWVGWVEHLEVCPACHGGGAPGCPEAEVLALDLVRLVEPVIGRPILGRPAIAAPAGHQPVDLCLAGELGTSGEPRSATGCLCRLVRHRLELWHECPGDEQHAAHRWPWTERARSVVLGGRIQTAPAGDVPRGTVEAGQP